MVDHPPRLATMARMPSATRLGDTPEVLDALELSSLRGLDHAVVDRLTEGAMLRDVAPGAAVHVEWHPSFLPLVIRGLFRAYVSSPSGRTMPIRYCRPGALMGT